MIDLMPFCSTERENLRTPWSAGDYTYATNGHIAIRVARRADVERESDIAVQAAMDKAAAAVRMAPLPAYQRPDLVLCETCRGFGCVVTCPQCNGEGGAECCECGQDAECRDCRGKGSWPARKSDENAVPCSTCSGKGRMVRHTYICVLPSGVGINEKYVALIAALPGVEIDVGVTVESTQDGVRFSFDGGDGIVLPMGLGGTFYARF